MLWSEPIVRIDIRKELCMKLTAATRDSIP